MRFAVTAPSSCFIKGWIGLIPSRRCPIFGYAIFILWVMSYEVSLVQNAAPPLFVFEEEKTEEKGVSHSPEGANDDYLELFST